MTRHACKATPVLCTVSRQFSREPLSHHATHPESSVLGVTCLSPHAPTTDYGHYFWILRHPCQLGLCTSIGSRVSSEISPFLCHTIHHTLINLIKLSHHIISTHPRSNGRFNCFLIRPSKTLFHMTHAAGLIGSRCHVFSLPVLPGAPE